MTPDYKIIGTGSKGNAVRIGNVMVDCGMPYKAMKEDLYLVDTLLITHAHKDHINPGTYKKIREDFPRIRVYANYDVAYRVPVDVVVGSAPVKLKRGNRIIYPFEGRHDVPVTGFVIDFDGYMVFYATDTRKVENPTGQKLDLILIECNYDEHKLKQIAKLYDSKGYDPEANAHRHLSLQQAKAFYFGNRKGPESQMVELHMSERFR